MPYEKWQLGDWRSRVCPRRIVSDEAQFWLSLYSHYAKGHLLIAGPLADQPASYLEIMSLIASMIAEAQADDARD